MRRTRAVAFTALVAASALVLSACGNTDQEGTSSPSVASSAGGAAPSDSASASAPATDESSPSGSEGSEPSGSGSEAAPSSGGEAPAGGACGTPHGPYDEPASIGGSVNVSWNQPLYSWNNQTGHGNAVANTNPRYLANSGFFYYNDKLELVNNDSFGTCELVSEDPLTVKYTINKDVKWSDNVPVTAADLLLAWASQSQQYNEAAVATDDEGNVVEQDAVAFDAGSPAMKLVTDFPEIGDDGQSLTIKYDEFFVDYPFQLDVFMPAHIVAMKGVGGDDATKATDDMVAALKAYHADAKVADDKDGNSIADTKAVDKTVRDNVKKMVDFWNTGFDFTELPSDPSLYLSNGAYLLKNYVKDQYMTFEANPDYTWGPKPAIQTITYRVIPDAMGMMQALQNGEIDIANPQATADVKGAADALKSRGVEVLTGDGATYEHVDFAQDNGGPFDPKTYDGDKDKATAVRKAFMKTIPRADIVQRLIKPLNPEAVVRNSFNVVPGAPAYDAVAAANGMSEYDAVDIAGAKQLLADAGVTGPVDVRFMYAAENARRANEYKLIATSAKEAGFNVIDGANKDWGSLLSNTKVYDAALFGWQSTAIGASQIAPNFTTGGTNNFYGYSNKELDGILKKLNAEPDVAKQDALNIEVEKTLLTDGFGITIFQFPEIVSFDTNKVQNVTGIPLSPGYFWNFWEWTTTGS